MATQIEIRKMTTMEDLYKMQQVENAVWNMQPIPVHHTYTTLNNGGVILGAYDGDNMIGFLYSFPGFDGKAPYLCSHMLGILEDYRKSGIGMQMKFKQAEIAEQMGFPAITWTFDPLESLNAYLNLHKLGAAGVYYKENHYGSMDDELNQGLPTDRIQIVWDLQNKQAKETIEFDDNLLLLGVDNNHPVITDKFTKDFASTKDGWFVAIPANFQQLKQNNVQLAIEWRYKTRKIFQALYAQGYKATDLLLDRNKETSYYYFSCN